MRKLSGSSTGWALFGMLRHSESTRKRRDCDQRRRFMKAGTNWTYFRHILWLKRKISDIIHNQWLRALMAMVPEPCVCQAERIVCSAGFGRPTVLQPTNRRRTLQNCGVFRQIGKRVRSCMHHACRRPKPSAAAPAGPIG